MAKYLSKPLVGLLSITAIFATVVGYQLGLVQAVALTGILAEVLSPGSSVGIPIGAMPLLIWIAIGVGREGKQSGRAPPKDPEQIFRKFAGWSEPPFGPKIIDLRRGAVVVTTNYDRLIEEAFSKLALVELEAPAKRQPGMFDLSWERRVFVGGSYKEIGY